MLLRCLRIPCYKPTWSWKDFRAVRLQDWKALLKMYVKEREGTVSQSVILRPKLKDDLIIQVCVWGQKDGCRQLSSLADHVTLCLKVQLDKFWLKKRPKWLMMATTHWNHLPKTMVDFSSFQRSPNKTSFYSILQFNHSFFIWKRK